MGLRPHNATTPGSRGRVAPDFSELSQGNRAEKTLTESTSKSGGRNNNGRITSRFRGGGHKRRFRLIDFRRNKIGVPATVATVEYDPNRTARIALLHYADGEKRYILCPDGLKVGDQVVSSRNADIKPGNNLPLRFIPLGTTDPQHRAQDLGRRADRAARPASARRSWPRRATGVRSGCRPARPAAFTSTAAPPSVRSATSSTAAVHVGKAGRTRWKGRRPHNRGVTMNPVDHPMGGGEGRSSGGRHPCSPWGQLSKGLKTRQNKRTDAMIIKHRGKKA